MGWRYDIAVPPRWPEELAIWKTLLPLRRHRRLRSMSHRQERFSWEYAREWVTAVSDGFYPKGGIRQLRIGRCRVSAARLVATTGQGDLALETLEPHTTGGEKDSNPHETARGGSFSSICVVFFLLWPVSDQTALSFSPLREWLRLATAGGG